MRYRDSYDQIEKLKKELQELRRLFYNYEANLPDKEFYKLQKSIKEIEKKIKFLENIRRANEKVRTNEEIRKSK